MLTAVTLLTVNKSKTESSIMSRNHGNTFAYRKDCQLSLHIVSKDAMLYEVQMLGLKNIS
jgi:hypothetical protein